MLNNLKEKCHSWALWLSLAALICYVVKALGGVDISEPMEELMGVLLPVLVGFGIVNNPNNRSGF